MIEYMAIIATLNFIVNVAKLFPDIRAVKGRRKRPKRF